VLETREAREEESALRNLKSRAVQPPVAMIWVQDNVTVELMACSVRIERNCNRRDQMS